MGTQVFVIYYFVLASVFKTFHNKSLKIEFITIQAKTLPNYHTYILLVMK